MRSDVRRVAWVAAAAACVYGTMGCSGGDEGSDGDGEGAQSVDEVASSWGEIPPRDEQRTRAYLAGDGAALLEYAEFAADLDERLDDADRCAGLRAEWNESYSRRDVVDWLYALPDPILGRLWGSQVPTADRAVRACADGDRDTSAELAGQVADIQELVDRRLDQLEVER